MIEIPSAALIAPVLAQEVDFFSIGTNDLTQYTLAIDRGHPTLSGQADGLHPAVLRLIGMTVEAAHAHGKWVGVRSEEHTSELQSLMRSSYAVFCLTKKNSNEQHSKSCMYSV